MADDGVQETSLKRGVIFAIPFDDTSAAEIKLFTFNLQTKNLSIKKETNCNFSPGHRGRPLHHILSVQLLHLHHHLPPSHFLCFLPSTGPDVPKGVWSHRSYLSVAPPLHDQAPPLARPAFLWFP